MDFPSRTEVGLTVEEVLYAIERISKIASEISNVSEKPASSIEQVNTAVTQINEVTQQNATLVEQATATTYSLESQVLSVKSAVPAFKIAKDYAA